MAKIVTTFQYCPSVAIKVGLTFDMFSNVIFSMDNGRNSSLYENAIEGKVRIIMYHIYLSLKSINMLHSITIKIIC